MSYHIRLLQVVVLFTVSLSIMLTCLSFSQSPDGDASEQLIGIPPECSAPIESVYVSEHLRHVPLTIHVVCSDNGDSCWAQSIDGGDAQTGVNRLIAEMNTNFQSCNVTFFWSGTIDTIRSTALEYLAGSDRDILFNTNYVPGTINVYFVWSAANLITGFAKSSPGTRLWVQKYHPYKEYLASRWLPHELGHCLGLVGAIDYVPVDSTNWMYQEWNSPGGNFIEKQKWMIHCCLVNSDSISSIITVPVTLMNRIGVGDVEGSTLKIDSVSVSSGDSVTLLDGDTHVGKTNHEMFFNYQGTGNYKHHDWNQQNHEYRLQQNFTVDQTIDDGKKRNARFILLDTTTIRAELLPDGMTGTIGWCDPWYVDDTITLHQPDPPVWQEKTGTFTTGVFLNQNPPTDSTEKPYYSVRAPQTQTIGNFTCVFDHWEATGTDIIDMGTSTSTYNERAVVFRSSNAVVRAMYKATGASITVPIDSGWSMVSVPDTTNNMYKLSVYPYAQDQSVFTSNGGSYYPVDTLKVGKGYWINYPPNRLITYSGKPAFKVGILLGTGWNMIGSLSTPIQISSIDTTIIYPSSFREYDSSGYHLTESIREGIGYWVKAKQAGTLWLDASSSLSIPENTIAYQPPPAPGVPSTPALQAPTNGATGISLAPILYWYTADGAVTYRLQVSTSSTFSSTVFNQSGITATSKQIGTLAYSTRYYWRVNATNLSGTSNWSNIRYFTTESAPPPPTDPCLTTSSISTLDQFTVSDASGKRQTLYAKNGKMKLHGKFTDFDMPPEPVGGIFYVKFKSDKLLENIPPGMGFIKIPIKVKNAKYPITVNWKIKEENGVKYWISKSGNDNDKQPLSGNGSTGLSSTKDGDIIIIAQAIDPCEIVWKAGIGEGVDENNASIPTEYKLEQNIPNPFNPSSIVNYQLPIDNWVTLRVYNILGKEVATLVDGFEPAGYKSVNFDASSLPSGVYFYRMIAGSYTDVKKMMVAK